MEWKRDCPISITHRRSAACTTRQSTGCRRWRVPASITSSGSSGRISAIRCFDRNSKVVFADRIEGDAMSFGLYSIGFAIVIGGLIYAAYLLHMPTHWIAVGATVLLGVGILTGGKATRQKDPVA